MDQRIKRRLDTRLVMIKNILDVAEVPKFWYSINKPVNGKICIEVGEFIHVYTWERDAKVGEHKYDNWQKAMEDFAERIELKYTERIKNELKRTRSAKVYHRVDIAKPGIILTHQLEGQHFINHTTKRNNMLKPVEVRSIDIVPGNENAAIAPAKVYSSSGQTAYRKMAERKKTKKERLAMLKSMAREKVKR